MTAARLHRFTPVYGEWPQCDLCGEREDAPIHKQPEEPSAAKAAGPGFPEGSTLEQTGPETWQLTMPGPTEEELRYAHEFPPQTLTYEPRGTT